MKRAESRSGEASLRLRRWCGLPHRRQEDLHLGGENGRSEDGAERAILPGATGTGILVEAVLMAIVCGAFCGKNESCAGQPAGAKDEGTALCDRRRHVAGGNDDANREANEDQLYQLAARRIVIFMVHKASNCRSSKPSQWQIVWRRKRSAK